MKKTIDVIDHATIAAKLGFAITPKVITYAKMFDEKNVVRVIYQKRISDYDVCLELFEADRPGYNKERHYGVNVYVTVDQQSDKELDLELFWGIAVSLNGIAFVDPTKTENVIKGGIKILFDEFAEQMPQPIKDIFQDISSKL